MVDCRSKRVESSVKLSEDKETEPRVIVAYKPAKRVFLRVIIFEEDEETMQDFNVSVPGSETTKIPL